MSKFTRERRRVRIAEAFQLWQFVPDGEIPSMSRTGLVKPLLLPYMSTQLAEVLAEQIVVYLPDDS